MPIPNGMRLFFGCPNYASFVERDLRILRRRYAVVPRKLMHHNPLRLLIDLQWVARSRLVFLWFLSLRYAPIVIFSCLLRKKVVVVVGGYEAANLPEIGYGAARRAWQRAVVRFLLMRADRILAVSQASLESIKQNLRVPQDRVTLLYHGFADPGEWSESRREQMVVTIGAINRITWLRKGIKEFFEIAALMPDIEFAHIGAVEIDIQDRLKGTIPENVRFLGEIPFSELGDHLTRAKVYLQLSRHESFGCAVADAMLFGCIPVVSGLYALPEVVGDCGITLSGYQQQDIEAAIREALSQPAAEALRCRRRILTVFPEAKRADELLSIMREVEMGG